MIHGYELREKTILIHPILNFTFENVERRFLFHVQVPRFQTPLTWFRLFYYLYIIVRGTVTVKIYLQCTKIPMKLKKTIWTKISIWNVAVINRKRLYKTISCSVKTFIWLEFTYLFFTYIYLIFSTLLLRSIKIYYFKLTACVEVNVTFHVENLWPLYEPFQNKHLFSVILTSLAVILVYYVSSYSLKSTILFTELVISLNFQLKNSSSIFIVYNEDDLMGILHRL